MNKMIRILFLAANPLNSSALHLLEEANLLNRQLQLVCHHKEIELYPKLAISLEDIYQAMIEVKPVIVHFAGHSICDNEGILLPSVIEQGDTSALETLARMLGSFQQLECVVLNACYSEVQATIIAKYVNYLIGMQERVFDKAAIEFASMFYEALCNGKSIPFAYNTGCYAMRQTGTLPYFNPVLKMRDRGYLRKGTHQNSQNDIYGFILNTLIHLYNQHWYETGKQGESKMAKLLVHLIINWLLPSPNNLRFVHSDKGVYQNFQDVQVLCKYRLFDYFSERERVQIMTHYEIWLHIVSKFKGVFLQYASLYRELSQNDTNANDYDELVMLDQEAAAIESFFKQWNNSNILSEVEADGSFDLSQISSDEEDMVKNELTQITAELKLLGIQPQQTNSEIQNLLDALNDHLESAWRSRTEMGGSAQLASVDNLDSNPLEQQPRDQPVELESLLNCIRVIATIEGSSSISDRAKTGAALRCLLELRLKDDFKRHSMGKFQQVSLSLVYGNHNDPVRRLIEKSIKDTSSFFNPLIIYGGAGLGKTTLLKAIANTYASQGHNVLYCPSSRFIADVNLAKEGSLGDLLFELYKDATILLFDDLRLLDNKKKAQQKLGELIEHFVEHDRQVIVTSDALPIHMSLEESLFNQLERGVPIRVEEPDVNTKLRLLKSMMGTNHSLSDDVLKQIAEQSGANIRELEGALKFISAQMELGKQTNVETALETWKQERQDAASKALQAKALDAAL